jgi:hypothetical protein
MRHSEGVVTDLIVGEVLGGVQACAEPPFEASCVVVLAHEHVIREELNPGALRRAVDERPLRLQPVLLAPAFRAAPLLIGCGDLGNALREVSEDVSV